MTQSTPVATLAQTVADEKAVWALTARVAALEAHVGVPIPPTPPGDDDAALAAAEATDAANLAGLLTAESNDATAITALTARVAALEARPTSGTSAVPVLPGVVQLDEFAGDDDAKLTEALSYAAQQSHRPGIMWPARDVHHSQVGRVPYSGMKLLAPFGSDGPKNPEQGPQLPNHLVHLDGSGPWFDGTSVGNIFSVSVRDLCFQGNPGAQFWRHAAGSLYACEFHSLTFFGMGSTFGNRTELCRMTQVVFSGHWQVQSGTDQQFNLGGSDCQLWVGGYCNLGGGTNVPPPVDGTYLAAFHLEKTKVGYLYSTAFGQWRGLHLTGGNARFIGGSYEGNNAGQPCAGNQIRIDGGQHAFFGTWTAYGMAAPSSSEHGIIEVNGGSVLVDNPTYDHGNAAASVPLVWVNGGRVEVRSVQSATADVPVVHAVGGTLTHDGSVTVA